ncbi:MAG: 16S rRNA (uracil(1498)-N(3))-methyltransferase [Campylobacterales bacterium]|nr:16S rRNA (uracil(1498)-N(3))-methyltransferase [Campylobacterales bacterium]
MQFLYHPQAKESRISLIDNDYKYIVKARRHKVEECIFLRNLADYHLYRYLIESITKKEAHIKLIDHEAKIVEAARKLHIGWCIIEPKNIEKHITTLNEMGVDKITFIYCARSQKNFKIDFERLNKILINSSSQCGRSSIIKLETSPSLEEFKTLYPHSFMLNFSDQILKQNTSIDTLVIGCEGGFTQSETALFGEHLIGLDTPLILKSESAAVGASSILLL